MRVLLIGSLCAVLSGCTFGVKTCSVTDPCLGGGQCVQGVCTIPIGGGGGQVEMDAGGDPGIDAGIDAGPLGGGSGGGAGGGTGGGAGGGGGSTGFDAGPLEGVVFLTPPRNVRAGECSEVIQVGVFVEDGGIGEDGGAAPLLVGFTDEETHIFEDSSCVLGTREFVVPQSRVVSIYFKTITVGSALVSVSLDSLTPVGQVQTVVSAAPGRLSFGPPTAVAAGACSGLVPVQVRDGFGNITSVTAALPVALSSDSNTTQFFAGSDGICQSPLVPATVSLSAGTSGTFFRFRDPVRGLPVFAAAADAGIDKPAVEPAIQEQEVF